MFIDNSENIILQAKNLNAMIIIIMINGRKKIPESIKEPYSYDS